MVGIKLPIVVASMVIVAFAPRTDAAARPDLVTFDATIDAVDAEARTVTITRPGGKRLDLEVGRDAVVSIGGREATLGAIQVGRMATLTYEARLEIVTRIEVGVGEEIGEVRKLEGHTGTVLGVAFSPDGKLLASAGDTTVRPWDASAEPSGQAHIVLATGEPEPKGFIAVAFSPDGRTLAASKFDGSIALWDVTASPPRMLRVLRKHGDPVIALAFSPDGKALVSGGRNEGMICFWDMNQETDTPMTTIPAEKNGVWSLAFSPDGEKLAVGVSFPPEGGTPVPGQVWLWDIGRRPYVKRAVIKEARRVPMSLAFSPDGSRLAFGDGDVARIIDART